MSNGMPNLVNVRFTTPSPHTFSPPYSATATAPHLHHKSTTIQKQNKQRKVAKNGWKPRPLYPSNVRRPTWLYPIKTL